MFIPPCRYHSLWLPTESGSWRSNNWSLGEWISYIGKIINGYKDYIGYSKIIHLGMSDSWNYDMPASVNYKIRY